MGDLIELIKAALARRETPANVALAVLENTVLVAVDNEAGTDALLDLQKEIPEVRVLRGFDNGYADEDEELIETIDDLASETDVAFLRGVGLVVRLNGSHSVDVKVRKVYRAMKGTKDFHRVVTVSAQGKDFKDVIFNSANPFKVDADDIMNRPVHSTRSKPIDLEDIMDLHRVLESCKDVNDFIEVL